jgi:hypothetical protein
MKKILIVTIFSLIYCSNLYSKIEDKRVWDNIYNNCMSKYKPGDQRVQKQSFSNYCECAADMVMDQFTLNEVKKLDEKVLGKSDKEMSQVIKLDEKMNYIVTYCINTHVKPFIK